MVLSSLKNQLIEAYSLNNLNDISSKIIALNKSGNKNALTNIAKIINDYTPFDCENQNKLFTRLIMLYHPDKLKEYQQKIITATKAQTLQEMMHIVQLNAKINSIEQTANSSFLSPEAFEEEYGWNYQSTDSDYYVVRDDDDTIQPLFDEENPEDFIMDTMAAALDEQSFLGAVKRKIYGPAAINFPVHLLEDLEEIEMAEYEIAQLDGVEFCTYIKILDLSHNQLYDIKKLEHCEHLQELYLTDNKIFSIDGLGGLYDLRVLDLSDNRIDDISSLYDLPCLEFANLMNNNISQAQVDFLKGKGVVVVC